MRPLTSIVPPQRPASPFGDLATRGHGELSRSKHADGAGQFAKLMVKEVGNVNSMQMNANDGVHALLTGEDVNEAEVLTAVQKADLAFRMLLQVRNKLIEAYREVQQIQI